MTMALFLGILQGVTGLLESQLGDKAKTIGSLETIVAAALAAYHAETGQPLDVTKLKPFIPIS